MAAIITFNANSQKRGAGYFSELLSSELLQDICRLVTGQNNYETRIIHESYNKGRLLVIDYNGVRNYVTLSEVSNEGRNSSVQSVPTAVNIFYADPSLRKRLFFYFLPHSGNLFTDYHRVYYKLMATAGIVFLNSPEHITSYSNPDQLIYDRNENQRSNPSNNSSYITKTENTIQIYGKVYGANKYESTLLCLALSKLTSEHIDFFNICEQDLKVLPQSSMNTLNLLSNVSMINTSITLERRLFEDEPERDTLRSPLYSYNLLQRIGHKHCAMCDCEIDEIIQGAHVWGVSQIRRNDRMNLEEKFNHAVSGHNGLWLCQNHHKLFDSHILVIDNDGRFRVKATLDRPDYEFIRDITKRESLANELLSDDFRQYLHFRNSGVHFENTIAFAG